MKLNSIIEISQNDINQVNGGNNDYNDIVIKYEDIHKANEALEKPSSRISEKEIDRMMKKLELTLDEKDKTVDPCQRHNCFIIDAKF